ncbi:UNVERIFIED_ORG: protein-L-isoaspartate(D-aspartate) O-methyltransferase [Microbispora rosea subsp. rosea]
MDWRQCTIEFPDAAAAYQVAAAEVLPALTAAQNDGVLQTWWFIRKQGRWRLRYALTSASEDTGIIGDVLDHLATTGRIVGWMPGIYEPETHVFGGPHGMDAAHQLFHADSRDLLTHVDHVGVRETSILLCGVLMRAAGLDWYEQGDVWAKVAELRPLDPVTPPWAPEHDRELQAAMRRLLTADARTLPTIPTRWSAAFEDAGQALAGLNREGRLTRGLRAVLAHHVIFHANRANVPGGDQAAIATLAARTVLHPSENDVFPAQSTSSITKVPLMTHTDDQPDSTPEELRNALTDRLLDAGTIRTPSVEAAFRTVPRHLFVPSTALHTAYGDDPIYTKHDGSGASLSAASQPTIVAMMLEQLGANPGDRVLEAGAGTGYNAALLATIVGPDGHVTTIDVDDDLVTSAREHLAAADVSNVTVILSDGALGHLDGAPYDRIIATVGAWEVPPAWLNQLAPGGRLVVPLRLRGVASRSIVFERGDNGWHSVNSQLATFMPLRGVGDDARRTVALTPEHDVTLQVHKDNHVDPGELAGVLDTPPVTEWTGVAFPPMVSFEWMDLWLCLRLDNPLMRMNIGAAPEDHGQVHAMFPWGSMATTRGADLAYLTIRPNDKGDTRMYEVGVIGHGPDGRDLAERVATEIRTWDWFRGCTVRFSLPDTPPAPNPDKGQFVLDRPTHPILITWE